MIYDNQKLASQIYQPIQTQLPTEQSPRTVETYQTQDGRKFIKTFLLDSSVNKANFAVRKDYIPKHIKRYEGKPYILAKVQLDNGQVVNYHPLWDDVKVASVSDFRNTNEFIQDYINKLFKSQEPYTIGLIRKVEQEPYNHDIWAAHIEFTAPKAIEAYDQGHIPKFVSPSFFAYNYDENGYVVDFEPLHIGAVDIPSYGFEKARVYSECTGSEALCLGNNIKQGSIPIHCIEKELMNFKNFVNSSFIDSHVKSASKIDLSAQVTTNSTGTNAPAMDVNSTNVNPQAGNVQTQRTNDAISSFVATSPTQTINPQAPQQQFPNQLIPKTELDKFAEPLNNEIKSLKATVEELLAAKQKDDLADKKDII